MEHIAEEHEGGYCPVGFCPLHEHLGLELGENLSEHLIGYAEALGTEEHPACCHEMEGDEGGEGCEKKEGECTVMVYVIVHRLLAWHVGEGACCWTDAVPDLVDAEEEAMQSSPEDEVEGCAVP